MRPTPSERALQESVVSATRNSIRPISGHKSHAYSYTRPVLLDATSQQQSHDGHPCRSLISIVPSIYQCILQCHWHTVALTSSTFHGIICTRFYSVRQHKNRQSAIDSKSNAPSSAGVTSFLSSPGVGWAAGCKRSRMRCFSASSKTTSASCRNKGGRDRLSLQWVWSALSNTLR